MAAFEPTLRDRGGVWVGWPGIELHKGERLTQPDDPYNIEAVSIKRSELKSYYHGFANRTLWPLFHSLPTQTAFRRSDWQAYVTINRRFADVTANVARAGDTIWVNDYHLFLLPNLLRDRVPDAALGFFLHIPFPPFDIHRLLPWATEVIEGMLGADLIGFHVRGYVRNFLECARRQLHAKVDRRRMTVEYKGHVTKVGAFPLGIDFEHFERLALAAPSRAHTPEQVILGVDRLDYTKGISHRINAFAHLLEAYPEHRQRATLLQVAVPSRSEVAEYRQLKREIDELVGQVNGRFASATWSPIRYLYRSVPQDRLAALYRDADVAIVTPLRDGMNLVAKEYLACQVAEPGVLVLSMMAGAAETMPEAVLVNPYNVEGTAEALHYALTLDKDQRRARLEPLRARERANNVHVWAKSFLNQLARAARA